MINQYKNFLVAIPMLIVLLLIGCSSFKTIQTPKVAEDSRDSEITKCMDIMHGEWTDRPFVYVYEDPNKEGEWRPIINLPKDAEEYIAKGVNVNISFDQWRGKNVRAATVEYNPSYFEPSADWNRSDYYCFDNEGSIIEIHSNLELFDDNLKLLRTWTYNKDGSILKKTKELTNVRTETTFFIFEKAFDPNNVSFTDKPPYMATSYQDLVEHLKLPDEVNEGPNLERIDLNEFIKNSDFQESEYLQFVSKEKSLIFNYRPDWICKEMASDFRVDCYPKYRIEQIRKYGLPEEIVFPEIRIVSHECQLDPEKKVGSVILSTSDEEDIKYNTFYKKYNNCEVGVKTYSEIDTEEELSKIITEQLSSPQTEETETED